MHIINFILFFELNNIYLISPDLKLIFDMYYFFSTFIYIILKIYNDIKLNLYYRIYSFYMLLFYESVYNKFVVIIYENLLYIKQFM
jgi:hypothetical protein